MTTLEFLDTDSLLVYISIFLKLDSFVALAEQLLELLAPRLRRSHPLAVAG